MSTSTFLTPKFNEKYKIHLEWNLTVASRGFLHFEAKRISFLKNELVFIVLKRPKPVDSSFNGKPSKVYEFEVVDLKGDLTTMSVTAGDYKKIRKAAEKVLDVQKRYPNLPMIPYVKISSALPFQQPMNSQR
jgi:hypothetical protein